jgi:hypothetical protein
MIMLLRPTFLKTHSSLADRLYARRWHGCDGIRKVGRSKRAGTEKVTLHRVPGLAATEDLNLAVPDHGVGVYRAYALPLLQDTVAPEDFFEKIRVQGRGEALLGDAQHGRVRL